MIRILLSIIICALHAFITHAEATSFQGVVFHDVNRNGVMDAGEHGIAGVCVSNGREVVQTGADGRWILPGTDSKPVFVIKPAGYNVAQNEHNLPRHFFLTSENPQVTDISFPLYETSENSRFSALFYSDTQARGLKEVNYIMHDVVQECIGTDAAFGVSLGDIVADDPALFAEVSQGTGQIGIPWYYIFGNHDHDRDISENDNKDKTFREYFGPSTYAFEHGEVVFIGLNNVYFRPDGKYHASLTGSQLEFVKNYLSFVPESKLVVLMMHIPITRIDNREKLYELISHRPHTFSISGHVHEQSHIFIDEQMGWKGSPPHHHLINATVSGSWWCGLHDEVGIPHATMNDGAPNGYSVITFNGNQYSIRFKAARRPADYQMNIYLPDEMTTLELDTTRVLVNIFAGSARSLVEMRIGRHGDWRPMEQVDVIDPECLRMHRLSPVLDIQHEGQPLEQIAGYKMDFPSVSKHMWQGRLQKELSPGTYTISVRTTDMFNQTWTAHRIFRVRAGESTFNY